MVISAMLTMLATNCDNVDNRLSKGIILRNLQWILIMSSKLTTNQPKRFNLDIRPRPKAQHTEQHQLGHLYTNIEPVHKYIEFDLTSEFYNYMSQNLEMSRNKIIH